MRFIYITLLWVTSVVLPNLLQAQRNLDVGFFFGVSHYMGDLQQADLEILEVHQARGFFLRYNFTNYFSLQTHLYQGTISGSDALYPTLEKAWKRNLSFRSPIYEAGLQGELSIMNFGIRKQHKSKRLIGYVASAYIFGGVAGFYFNPQAQYQGKWYDLQPLGTEGQGLEDNPDRYDRLQMAIPMGFGFKIRSTRWSCLGFSVGFRKTFTDYLDDVSGQYPDLKKLEEVNPLAAALSYRSPEVDIDAVQDPQGTERGNPKGKDMYFFAGVSLAITIGK